MNKNVNLRKEFNYNDNYPYFSTRLAPVLTIILLLFVFGFIFKVIPKELYVYLIIVVVYFIIVGYFAILLYYNSYPNIIIEDDIIRLNFPFRTYIIKTEDIIDIVELDREFRSNLLRIDINNLSTIHKVIGFIFGSKGKPAFLVRKDINHFNELVSILATKTGIVPKKQLSHF